MAAKKKEAGKTPKRDGPEPERLRVDVPWEEAAERLLSVPAKSTPPRPTRPKKKA